MLKKYIREFFKKNFVEIDKIHIKRNLNLKKIIISQSKITDVIKKKSIDNFQYESDLITDQYDYELYKINNNRSHSFFNLGQFNVEQYLEFVIFLTFQKNNSILECGCGAGSFAGILNDYVKLNNTIMPIYEGFDYSKIQILRAKHNYPNLLFKNNPLEYYKPEKKFDYCLALSLFPFIKNNKFKLLKKMLNYSKKGIFVHLATYWKFDQPKIIFNKQLDPSQKKKSETFLMYHQNVLDFCKQNKLDYFVKSVYRVELLKNELYWAFPENDIPEILKKEIKKKLLNLDKYGYMKINNLFYNEKLYKDLKLYKNFGVTILPSEYLKWNKLNKLKVKALKENFFNFLYS